ncbi:MAG: AraC family transcriptional regulator [Chthoniobacteraceae bacterium]
MHASPFGILDRRLSRAFERRGEDFIAFGPRQNMGWGLETRRQPERYSWEGLKRGASAKHPKMLFQFTLDGSGEYAEGGKTWALAPGDGFLTVIPSAHRYRLPESSAHWTFFWLIVEHPLLIERIRQLRRKEQAVQAWAMESVGLQRVLNFLLAACAGQFRDVWIFEELLFGWILGMERELHERRYPHSERERLLKRTRALVESRLERPPNAMELAGMHGLERTTFSRFFKAKTGMAPAAFITEVRLEHALKLLRTTAKLEDIAVQTGFADANHFCKVFRAHYSTSPGVYRRQLLRER